MRDDIKKTEWRYFLPTKIIFGSGVFDKIAEYISEFLPKKILIVTGRKSMEKLGITNRIREYLSEYKIEIYDKVEPNPAAEIIDNGVKFLKKESCDLVISIGGGSAIDAGKAIAILGNNIGSIEDFLSGKEKIKNRGIKFIGVPTTSGTGSEVTTFSVITTKENRKKVLSHEYMYPNLAIVDPKLTLSLPKYQTAITGLDALSHGVEAYWSKNNNPVSDIFALESIELIFENLKKACDNLKNLEYRENMSKASLFAGLAFSNTLTTAVHVVSYPITSFFGIPHGLACAIVLPYFLEYNSEVGDKRIEKILNIIGEKTPNKCAERIRTLMKEVDLPTKLSEVGIKKEDIDLIVKESLTSERIKNNPRELDEKSLREILLEAFK